MTTLVALMTVYAASETLAHPPFPEHGLDFNTPAMTWDEALPLGNGIMGALLWGDGAPLNISLDRTDLWDLRPVPEFQSEDYSYAVMREWEKAGRYEELAKMYELPYHRPAPTKIPAGRLTLAFENAAFRNTRLDLATATGSASFGDGAHVTAWIHATAPLGVLEIEARSLIRPELVAPLFGGKEHVQSEIAIEAGELAQLGYGPPQETSGDQFAAYEQEGWGGFRFSVYVGWRFDEGAGKTTVVWTVASSFEGDEPMAIAKARVEKALDGGLNALRTEHLEWWRAFWDRTWLRVPNPRIERQWYLDTYKLGAAARPDAPPVSLQGPWTADNGKLPPWKGDYHHDLNTQMTYWPCYSGNRLEAGQGFVDWLWEHRDNCRAWTRTFFDMPGLAVPMTTDLHCNQIGGWRQYTHSAMMGAWLAQHFYWQWKYSGDPDFLRGHAYPYARECAVFVEAVTSERDAKGLRTLPLSSSPEFYDNKPEAWFPTITTHDLSLCRWLFGAAAEMADLLGEKEDAAHWRGVLSEFPQLFRGENGALLVAENHPLPFSHRHHSHLMAIYPLGLVDWANGEEDQRTMRASIEELEKFGPGAWVGFSYTWLASLAARARDGERAGKALDIFAEAFVLRSSFNANGDQTGKGYSTFTYRPFTLETNCSNASGLQEMLLQSHTGVIDVFPAIPADWADVAFHNLRAQGAFLVSAEKRDGKMVSLRVQAERGGVARLRLPGTDTIKTFELAPGASIDVLTTG
ncbi:MAG TPA: glycoside hydrolase N-terminal domain-containing protein [Candidatus Hydrogenedentes bacterium]|nr:glycoside hydrolase N-terminal domain-containing protein [Candidatus Hydrogenedentota bacterium]HQM47529.1 glycoside hydrolase N-terminal domain-containing protein [Candidatus Hydrogenedentota bacterium]